MFFELFFQLHLISMLHSFQNFIAVVSSIISPYLLAYVFFFFFKPLYCKSNVILGRNEIRCVSACVHLYACVYFHINP